MPNWDIGLAIVLSFGALWAWGAWRERIAARRRRRSQQAISDEQRRRREQPDPWILRF
jgi:hypothetical protein